MIGDFKKDPILKILLAILIGVLSLSLLLNLYAGGGRSMDHSGGYSSYGVNGFYQGSLIGGMLMLLIRLLMIVLVLAVLGGIVVWFKNNFFKNGESKFIESINKDPILKMLTIVTSLTFMIVLIMALFSNLSLMGKGGLNGYMTFNPTNSIAGLLTMLMQILSFVLVISLIMAVIAYVKNQYEQGNLSFAKVNTSNQENNTRQTESKNDGIIGTIE